MPILDLLREQDADDLAHIEDDIRIRSFVVQNNDIVHNDTDPFCDCPSCTAELEAALQSSLIRHAQNRTIARRTARTMRLERIEARLERIEMILNIQKVSE